MTALVLSGSYTETNRFAQQKNLGYGIRHVVSASNLDGRRPTSIHILPSYHERRDIHAVRAAMKHVERRVRHIPVLEYVLEDGVYSTIDELADEFVDPGLPDTPDQEVSVVESADMAPSPTFAPDESKDAVPGQTGIEEHILAAENEGLAVPSEPVEVAPEPVATGDELPDWMQ